MKFQVNNFRKIEKADIDIDTVTLVSGHNEAGKTSICQALAAAMTGNANVLGVTKKDAKKLVRDGSKTAAVTVSDDTGSISIKWPSMDVESTGNLAASEFACGTTRLTQLPADQAAKVIADILDAHPTQEDFMEAVSGISDESVCQKIWEMICDQGWDATHNSIKENARDLKAMWKQITGDTWGKQKAVNWTPDGFAYELEGADEEFLQKEIESAQQSLEEAIAENAVTGKMIEDLRERAGHYDDLAAEKNKLVTDIEAAKEKLATAESRLTDNPLPPDAPMQCPHCSGAVLYRSGSLVAADGDSIDRDALVKAHDEAKTIRNSCSAYLRELEGNLSEVMTKGKAAVKAIKELKELEESGGLEDDDNTEDTVNSFRSALDAARGRLEMFKQWKNAGETHSRIEKALKMAEEVGPDGLRQRKAGEAVETFNADILHPLCHEFGIAPVSIDLDMNVLYRTHLYQFLSESAQFRVDTVLQVAIAKLDGSSIIIVDGADVVVGKDRGGLIRMLSKCGIPAFVSMSLSKPESTPSLKGIGGSVYWVENSVCKELED